MFASAERANAPVIVQLTPAARHYATPPMLLAMIQAAAALHPTVAYAIHLDHGTESHAFDAIENGYNSIMLDASHEAFADNIRRTKEVVLRAHAKSIVVEAELGVLSGVEDDKAVSDQDARYTNPRQAREFVQQTSCDSLAIAVGTSHGAYKFSGGQGLQFHILEQIQKELPGYPLVLHGSSAVNRREVDLINQFGGQLNRKASGVTDAELQKAITYGICKVNIATDLRLLWTRVHREFFAASPELFDPIVPGKRYMEAYVDFMCSRFEVMGATGKTKELKF